MAFVGSVDLISSTASNPVSGASVWASVGTALLLAGHTVQSYGTGAAGTYSSTGTGYSTSVLGSGTNLAWALFRDPAGLAEITIQVNLNGSLTNLARLKYSPAAKFSGGSPSASQTPSATDEVIWLGGGTDAAPTHGTAFNIAAGTPMRYHVVASNAAISGRYPWMLYGHTQGSTTLQCIIGIDSMIPGSFDSTDADPCACVVIGNTNQVKWWAGLGAGGSSIQTQTPSTTQLGFAGTQSVFPGSTNDLVGRFAYYTATYPKGYGAMLGLKAVARAYPNVINPTTDMRVYIGGSAAGYVVQGINNSIPTL